MEIKQLKQRLWQWRGVWITAPTVTGLLFLLRLTGALQLLEWVSLDQYFRWRAPEPTDSRIVLVTVTEADIEAYGWPISDGLLAKLITQLKQAQPRAIGLDLYREIPIGSGRQDLEQLFKTTPNLIGVGKFVSNAYLSEVNPPKTLEELGQVAASDVVVDADGKVRRGLVTLKDQQGQTIMTLGTRLALLYLQAENVAIKVVDPERSHLQIGKAYFTPLNPNDGGYVAVDAGGYQILANFRSPQNPFTTLSMEQVLTGKVPPNLLRNKVVMIGTAAESLGDYFFTSYSSDQVTRFPGVSIHAKLSSQILSAALDDRPLLRVWPEPLEWVWIFAWVSVGSALGWTLKPPRWTVLTTLVAAGVLVGSTYGLFLLGWWVVVVPPLVGLVVAATTNKGYVLWDNLKMSYRSLEEYSHTLEHRVEERTLELSQNNEKLQQEIHERERAEAALRENERQLRLQSEVLLALSRDKALYRGDLTTALQEITQAATHTLNIERASVWLYDNIQSKLECVDLYDRQNQRHLEGMELVASHYPNYFQALQTEWMVVVEDALQDPKTSELAESYLIPEKVTALLDISIQLGEKTLGILCLEQVGTKRAWDIEEQNFAGSLADLVALAIEANARKQAERALKAAEEKYRSIFENAVDGIFQIGPDGHFLSANPALAHIYGYESPLAMFQQSVHVASLYVDPDRHNEFIYLLNLQEEVTGFESQIYRQDGQIIWVSKNARAVRDEYRQIVYYEGIVEDITERKLAEEAIRISEEKFFKAFSASPDLITITTLNDGRYIEVNESFLKILGYSRPEVIGKTSIQLGIWAEPSERTKMRHIIQTEGSARDLEAVFCRKAGERLTVLVSAEVITLDGEDCLLAVIKDITDRKRAEEALRVEQAKSERLLLNILPEPIAQRLKQEERTIADSFAAVTVLFADIVGFTQLSQEMPPTELVTVLNDIFSAFDQLTEKHGLEKIKTIGDAYMVVGGMPAVRPDHAQAIAAMAIDMQAAIVDFNARRNQQFQLRIGINTGPVVAGVIGLRKFIYDLWGDAVNVASRMESHGVGGKIQVTEATYHLLKHEYDFVKRGVIQVKGKGDMLTYFLVSQNHGQ